MTVEWLCESSESCHLPEAVPFLASGWPGGDPFWPLSAYSWPDTVVTCSKWVRTGPDMSKSLSTLSAGNDKNRGHREYKYTVYDGVLVIVWPIHLSWLNVNPF